MVQLALSTNRASGVVGVALALLTAGACSAVQDNHLGLNTAASGGQDGSGGSGGSGGDPFDFGTGGDTAAGGGSSSQDDCSDTAKLIYMIGQGNNLYSFFPPTNEVKSIGIIDCLQGGRSGTPFSMAVDRRGIAWVLFSDGHIYNVDTATAICNPTQYRSGQQGYTQFGMGFVSNTAGSQDESLYLSSYDGTGLAKLDTQALTLGVVGSYDLLHTPGELTGTGDARLFGFFVPSAVGPVVIAEIDKSNAHILSQVPQPTIDIGSGWAFAFWGGDFYLFTNPDGQGSQIDRYRPSSGVTSTVLTALGDNIVGAGVSTCAPVESPL